jgi:hypothetical protein
MTMRFLVLMTFWASFVHAESAPQWIWGPAGAENEVRFFRKTFTVPPGAMGGDVVIAADDEAEVSVNRQRLGSNNSWKKPTRIKIRSVSRGENVLEIRARNLSGGAGVLARIEFMMRDSPRADIVTDGSWETSTDGVSGWAPVQLLGVVGTPPWGPISLEPVATPVDGISVKEGFRLELVHSARPGEGSWISMTRDDQGRLIISPQGSEPLLRLTIELGKLAKMERLETQVGGAMGLLHAFGALYLNGRGPDGYHLYRIRDADGDGRYESTQLLRRWTGSGGEHGPHALVKGPDDRIYAVAGNFTDVPSDVSPQSPVAHYAEDLALPRLDDVNGFGAGRKAPGGFVLSLDRDGQDVRLFSAGLRNAYGIAFNTDGELFGFDSDMERDWGTPWYRPSRIQHLVSGSDHGYREGSGKWPDYYADSLPPVVDVGIGSPTSIRFGTGTAFPARYQKALFGLDWVFGRLIAVHLQEQGAGYTGRVETLFRGSTMNLTDLEVGSDGALYCITGGRGTQSGLYRLSFVGNPALFPLFEVAGSRDIVIVQINPIERPGVPKTAREIIARMNEVTFNSSLLAELRAIDFVRRMLDEGKLEEGVYRRLFMHVISDDAALVPLGAGASLNATSDYFEQLFAIGRMACDRWLDEHFDDLGARSSVDLRRMFQGEVGPVGAAPAAHRRKS